MSNTVIIRDLCRLILTGKIEKYDHKEMQDLILENLPHVEAPKDIKNQRRERSK